MEGQGPQGNSYEPQRSDPAGFINPKESQSTTTSAADGTIHAISNFLTEDTSTLKRSDSDLLMSEKQANLVRGYSTRSSRILRPSETNSIYEPTTPLFRAATTGARGSLSGFNSLNMSRTGLSSDGRRTADFIDTSSTEYLISKRSPNSPSSYGQDEKNASEKVTENTRLNNYFTEDISALEEGEGPVKEKKKKKKKKDKNADGATVEPKVFFANERTYMQWLNFAAILLTLAITLINFGDKINTIVGGIFFGIAILFALYSFGFSRWRAWRITNKPHLRFDDIFGPVFLCVCLVACLILNAVLRFNSPSATTGYLGTNTTQPANNGDIGF